MPRNTNKWGPNGYHPSYTGLKESNENARKGLEKGNNNKLIKIKEILNSSNNNNTKYNKIKNMF